MIRNTFAFALVASAVIAKSDKAKGNNKKDPDFMTWVAQNNKNFNDAEDMKVKEQRWNKNKARVEELRAEFPDTNFRLNVMSDWTDEERVKLLGANPSAEKGRKLGAEEAVEPPQARRLEGSGNINWITNKNMGPVKNQYQCGSCWSFNATSVLEAVKSIKDTAANGGTLVAPQRISEQQGVDCSGAYGNNGCNGGWPSNYWYYVYDNGGAVKYADYTYAAVDQTCKDMSGMEKITGVANWSGYIRGWENILAALQDGPLSMAVWVDNNNAWYQYDSGVFPSAACSAATTVNHAVVLVGYESGEGSYEPGEEICYEAVPDKVVDPIPAECVPGEWVDAVPAEWIEGTPDQWVPGTEEVCRNSKRRERRRGQCNRGLTISEDLSQCCLPGEDGYWIKGEAGYWTEAQEGYWVDGIEETCTEEVPGYTIEGTAAYCETGPSTFVEAGPAVWLVQNSWGTNWGENGLIRIPVDKTDVNGSSAGVCYSQKYIQSVIAI